MTYVKNQGHFCSVPMCAYFAKCKGMCQSHYDKQRRRGTTDPYVFVPPTEKVCSRCKEEKSVEEFHHNKKYRDGSMRTASMCKSCYTDGQRGYFLKAKYGITLEDFMVMLKAQDFGCAICKTKENRYGTSERPRSFAVDHDHETGKVRGLLCQTCNRMLGLAGDSSQRLVDAAMYLYQSKGVKS